MKQVEMHLALMRTMQMTMQMRIKATQTQQPLWYESHHYNTKFDVLNLLSKDFMDHSPDVNGQLSKDRMGILLHDIILFEEFNKKPQSFE